MKDVIERIVILYLFLFLVILLLGLITGWVWIFALSVILPPWYMLLFLGYPLLILGIEFLWDYLMCS